MGELGGGQLGVVLLTPVACLLAWLWVSGLTSLLLLFSSWSSWFHSRALVGVWGGFACMT